MLVNKAGLVFVGERFSGLKPWQMPQGGIDPGETPSIAALREMREEIGTNKAEILAETPDWLRYDFPPELIDKVVGGRYRGQEQKWILARFTGDDGDININTRHPEFRAWKWVAASELLGLIVPFKRDVYRAVLEAFAPLLASASLTAQSRSAEP